MKKIAIVILTFVIFLTGCESSEIENQKKLYLDYIKKLESVSKTSNNLPFDVEVKYEKLIDTEVKYEVIIDNVKEDIYDIQMIAVHNKKTDDIFPSIGIFDEKENLLKGKPPKGLILVGYIDYNKDIEDFSCKIKLLIKYKTKDKKEKTVYYVTKK